MSKYFFKPDFNNLSQGERLRFVRELRYMTKPYVAEHFQLGGDKPKIELIILKYGVCLASLIISCLTSDNLVSL